MKTKKSTVTTALLLFCSLLAGAIAVEAEATFTVNSTIDAADANPGDGICATVEEECTLRAAIQEANALPGADTINLPAGTYLLTLPGILEDSALSGDLDILDTLHIIGELDTNGQPLSIVDANQLDRVFQIYYDVTASMEAIQIQGGKAPEDDNWVTFEDCGGGINNSGSLTLIDVVIANNIAPGYGGGIDSGSFLQITNSVIRHNDAFHGGGISNNGAMFITASQVLSNTASRWGGGIYQAGLGSMVIVASEISMNKTSLENPGYLVGGGGIFSNGTATLTGVDIIGNETYGDGGGIYHGNRYMQLEISNSTIADNKAVGIGGGISSSGDLLLQSSALNQNTALLGGGLFNDGNATVSNVSFELNKASEGAGIYNSSLDESEEYAGSLNLTNSVLQFNQAAVNGGGIYNKANAYLIDVDIEGNSAQDGAGFFHNGTPYLMQTYKPTVSIQSSLFQENQGSGTGAGIHNYAGILTIDNTRFVSNTALNGGGAANTLGNTTFTNCEFTENQAGTSGGGIFIYLGDVELVGTILGINHASKGAGIDNQFGDLLVRASTFENNSASESGGGIYNNGQATIERTIFYGNNAVSKGGAVYNAKYVSGPDPIVVASDGSISEELIFSMAAAEYNTVNLDTCIFGASEAGEGGHTIYNADTLELLSSTIENSGADQAVITTDGDTFMIQTIVASSSPHSACDGSGIFGGIYSLETGDGCDFDQGTSLSNTDPLLVFLTESPYLGLHPRSPAIDAGENFYCGEVDQAGNPRPVDGTGDGQAICDIGAYEAPEPDLIFADVPLNHWAYDYIIPLYEDGYIAGCATDPERRFCPEITMNRAESSVFIVRGIHPDQPGYLPATPTTQYFDDVPIGQDEQWFSKWVGELNEQGFTSGCNENPPLFCPGRKHIRAEATVFYLRLLNGPYFEPDESSEQIYNDVALGKWYYRWVNAAHEAGLIQACQTDMENMLFRPEEELTRAEAACMMMKAKELPPNPQGGTIVESGLADATLLNPILAADQASKDVNNKLFLGLLKVDAFSGEIVGDIAESWNVSTDGFTYTFNLRSDIFWTDGTPVTARDVKFTYDALGSDLVTTPYKYIIQLIESIEVVNDHTLQIAFSGTDCSSLQDFTIGIIPAHMYADDFSDIMSNPLNEEPTVTNGPFKFREWVRDDHITLIRNKTYHLGAPKVDAWIRRIYADSSSALAAFIAGEIDVMNIDPQDVASIEAEITKGQPFAIKQLFTDGYNYLAMNNGDPNNPEIGWVDVNEDGYFNEGEPPNLEQAKHPILGDRLVRQAIAYAIDYNRIVNEVAFGQGAPLAANVLPAIGWAYNSDLEPFALNLEQAASLLDAAGWVRDGNGIRMKDGKPLALSIMTNAGNSAREKMATIIKGNLDALGFDIKLDILEWGTVVGHLLSQQFDMVILGWTNMGPDPDDSQFWAYRYDDPGSGFNFLSYYNEDVDRKLFEAKSLPGCPVQGRSPLYHEIQAQIQEDAPYAFLFTPLTNVAWNTQLEGIDPGPWSTYYNVEEWIITPEQ